MWDPIEKALTEVKLSGYIQKDSGHRRSVTSSPKGEVSFMCFLHFFNCIFYQVTSRSA